jgi:hypothetical protein
VFGNVPRDGTVKPAYDRVVNEHERTVTLDPAERDVIRLALWTGDVRRYVPEVMRICTKLQVEEPLWFDDADVRDRVAANR